MGVSGGAAVHAALKLANETGKDVIAIVPDKGDRYLSVEGLF